MVPLRVIKVTENKYFIQQYVELFEDFTEHRCKQLNPFHWSFWQDYKSKGMGWQTLTLTVWSKYRNGFPSQKEAEDWIKETNQKEHIQETLKDGTFTVVG